MENTSLYNAYYVYDGYNYNWTYPGNGTGTEYAEPACKYITWYTLYLGVMPIICILGLVGNVVSFVVLGKDGRSPAAAFLLRALTMGDSALLILWSFRYIVCDTLFDYLGIDPQTLGHALWFTWINSLPLMYTAQTATIWLTVLIALSRFMAVCLPVKAHDLCTLTRVHWQVGFVALFSIAYNIPHFFSMRVYTATEDNYFKTQSDKNATEFGTYIDYTQFGASYGFYYIYGVILYQVMMFALPLLLLLVLNTGMMLGYHAASRRMRALVGRTHDTHAANEHSITLLMIVVVVVFIICMTPARIVQIVWGWRYERACTAKFFILELSNCLQITNSAVNFLIYFSLWKRFRQTLKACCCCCRH